MKKIFSLLLVLSLLAPALAPIPASAASESLNIAGKRALLVGKAAAYGAGGGLVVGLASQVFKKKTKNIFLFGSLGLYAGIAVGIYVIASSRGPSTYDGPDTYEDYGDFSRLGTQPDPAAGLAAHEREFAQDGVKVQVVQIPF